MNQDSRKKIKILFFAWGDSIHARRRINIFCDDSLFDVGVVSNHAYNFQNAHNYYLSGALKADKKQSNWFRFLNKAFVALVGSPLYILLKVFGGTSSLAECGRFVKDIFLVRYYINEFKPDVIFLQTLMYPCYLSYWWLDKIPMVVTFWNGDVTWWAKWTGIERMFKKQIVQYGVRKSVAITVNSKAAFQACLEYGIAKEKVSLIRYPGVNLKLFKPLYDKAEVRENLGLPAEHRIIFCPRGLGDYLNSDVIIEAVPVVIKSYPKTKFIFFVSEWNQKVWGHHLERANELGVTENIIGIDQVPWNEMPRYYQAADMLISISSNDSLPNCMLEAMASGVPVIMGDIPQIREWVIDGVNGYTVPPRDPSKLADRIIRVLFDVEQLVGGFIQNNIALVQHEADSQLVSEEIKQLLCEVVERHNDCV